MLLPLVCVRRTDITGGPDHSQWAGREAAGVMRWVALGSSSDHVEGDYQASSETPTEDNDTWRSGKLLDNAAVGFELNLMQKKAKLFYRC